MSGRLSVVRLMLDLTVSLRTLTTQLIGLKELDALAAKADTLPVSRIVVGFFNPTMVYKKVCIGSWRNEGGS